jgi:hypothetical protein
MHKARATSRIVTALIVGTVIGLPGAATRTARGQAVPAAQQGHCAVLGTYHVGPRVLPLAGAAQGRAGVQTPVAGQATVVPAIAWPAEFLRGTLAISAYTGCGGATIGSFAVHWTPGGPPIDGPRRGAPAMPCAVPCWLPPAGVISATGRFVQDPMHPHDATYVLVSATVTTARLRPQRGSPCSNVTDCPPSMVMTATATATFTDVTGYLQVPPPAGQRVTLSFLPPPGASTDVAPTAMVLQGWRGNAVPRPVPTPGPSPGASRTVPLTRRACCPPSRSVQLAAAGLSCTERALYPSFAQQLAEAPECGHPLPARYASLTRGGI